MKKRYIFLLIFALLLAVVLFFWSDLSKLYLSLSHQLPKVEKKVEQQGSQVKNNLKVLVPPPLRVNRPASQIILTQAGIIKYTNLAREKNGLSPLKENSALDSSAKIKVEDMFAKQYFAHESPLGLGVSDLAKSVGYNFITIGENMALGNFNDDQALVEAWMKSPGHRENILNTKYQEIGVSVIKGTYEGEITWMAVQHFGMPQNACPEVSQILKTTIDTNQLRLEEMMTQIKILESDSNKSEEEQKNYETLVEQYNNLIDENKKIVNQYNQQVIRYNNCLSGAK